MADVSRQQAALERLALLESCELSSEAKTETCRATRDLRSCGRAVRHVLSACCHACLCDECLQRSVSCPICRTPIGSSSQDKLRLFEELVDAGLIKKGSELAAESVDVGRLCSFFDVALKNNLVSLICHYVAEVCMDERAVSSNALVSILLDGVVVKDWCRRTFHSVALELRDIYNLSSKQMIAKTDVIDWNRRKLEGVAYVLEELEAPLVDQPLSLALVELRQLLESIRKVIQHSEVMTWCARHQFLESIRSSYTSIKQWHESVKERMSVSQASALPETQKKCKLEVSQPATLFIEDALANLGLLEDDDENEVGFRDLPELNWLHQGPTAQTPGSLRFRRDLESTLSRSPYPPESVRAAVDLLFLKGTCDLILAKKAIFLYFLFDRYWASPDENWRGLVDDYVSVFSISRHFMLESLVFYLLDDSSPHALEDACQLLPEIASHNTNPKVITVLLERQKPEAALTVLRATGRDSQGVGLVPLSDALATVRILLQRDLLIQSYLYQRSYVDCVKREGGDWLTSTEVLVSEISRLCMGMSLMHKMLGLPWRIEEEKYVREYLLDHAGEDPSSTAGNLLVVFYVQRCRYIDAYSVHKKLRELEGLWEGKCTDEVKISRVRMASEQRIRIVEKCMELLPELQRWQTRSAVVDSPQPDVEPLQPLVQAVDEQILDPLASPLFGYPGGNLFTEPVLEENNFPSTSAWASNNHPSFAQERLGPRAPAPPSPIISNTNFSVTNGLTAAHEFATLGGSPVQGRRLRYETELSRESPFPTVDLGNVRRGDGLDTAGPGSWASGVEKHITVKRNETGYSGNGSLLTLENGLRTGGLHTDNSHTMEMDIEGTSGWPSNGKRHPSDRSWLQSDGGKESLKDSTLQRVDDGNGVLFDTGILPRDSSKRNAEASENGGSRWRSDEGADEPVPSIPSSTRLKALSQSQGRSRSRFYSFRI